MTKVVFSPQPLFVPHKMNKNSRLHTNSNIKNIVFFEIGIGISANSFLLLIHILKFIHGHRPKPTDLSIGLLALIHLLMLVTKGFIDMDIFESSSGWDDITCKSIIYLHRSFRGLSLCTTCLLSVLQAITLSRRRSCLAKFKQNPLYYNLCFLLLLSTLYISFSSHLLITIVATTNLTSENFMYVTNSCSLLPMGYLMRHIFSALLTLREAFLISLMALASGYMVAILCRHRKQARHLHSTSLSPKASPEQRATRTILMLVSFFVVMSILDGIISYSRTTLNDHPIFYCIQILVAHSYAAFSPFVFISIEIRTINFSGSMCGRTGNI
ncbi:LOW QUALITY PROTEIN: vomeronasal type-1 receptor 94-like [Acomys russatus]|uniref:LOW QUALITY PROTEIN: vomeronasal type-1 receptor 94-like n=1 Tax=Acomys russatus TaxID=60746 RepID=UPI0021E2AF85|nr:LOW QUALITY PROTEIN: vomeronasal type-1 receptor 94-like [Acomys russatus]